MFFFSIFRFTVVKQTIYTGSLVPITLNDSLIPSYFVSIRRGGVKIYAPSLQNLLGDPARNPRRLHYRFRRKTRK